MNARRLGRAVDAAYTPAGLVVGTIVMLAASWLPAWLAWVNLPLAVLWPGHCACVALFGRRTPSATPPLALAAIGSFALWPLVGLAIAATGTRVTHSTLAAAIAVPCLIGAAWVYHRDRAHLVSIEVGVAGLDRTRRIRWIAVISIAAMLLGAWATVRFVPRPKPFEFSSIAFSGTWALTRTPVAVRPAANTTVLATVRNETDHEQTYRIAPTVATPDEQTVVGQWHAVSVKLAPHTQRQVELTGEFPVDYCYQQLRLTMTSDRGPRAASSDIGSNGSANAGILNDPGLAWQPITALVRLASDRCDRAVADS